MKNTKFLALTVLAVLTLGVTACETIEGAGRDIQHGGQAIENAAE